MSIGLIALIDDVVSLAKLAAASLDDAAAQATRAGVKAVGVVVDDTAVTPRYVMGFAAARELPIVGKIALGSLRNKLLILLPGALALSLLAPWAITPILMLGGAYLCFEGAEKVIDACSGRRSAAEQAEPVRSAEELLQRERKRVASAVRTDLILSAEIMAITLAGVAESAFWMRVFVLAVVGVAITALVYGVVAVIVKADDVGLSLAQSPTGIVASIGRGIVKAMPTLLTGLALLGTLAMLWVGGGIVLHGLDHLGWAVPARLVERLAHAVAQPAGAAEHAVAWLAAAAAAGVFGLALGGVLAFLVSRLAPHNAH
ncbi:MAG: DUF808 family protein [Geminicoccaceae bacterium]